MRERVGTFSRENCSARNLLRPP